MNKLKILGALFVISGISACGGGGGDGSNQPSGAVASPQPPPVAATPATYKIGGVISGLNAGSQLVLTNNSSNPVVVTSNGAFALNKPVTVNSAYQVTIATQPAGQTCRIVNASGSGMTADITNIGISCDASTESMVYAFPAPVPYGLNSLTITPILGSDGNFYGATTSVGTANRDTVYKTTPAGITTTVATLQLVATQGAMPNSLIQGKDGNLYGTVFEGGAFGVGAVFKITPDGVESLLYSFGASPTDATYPSALIQGSDGNFYGTSNYGGQNGVQACTYGVQEYRQMNGNNYPSQYVCYAHGYGTVFKVTPSGKESILYSFGSSVTDGQKGGGLIQGADGNFYGTTRNGGANGTTICTYGVNGPGCAGAYCNGTQCLFPVCSTTDFAAGCITGFGTIFQITPLGNETILHSFGSTSTDGVYPTGLIQASDGNLYGTTLYGGLYGSSSCYAVNPYYFCLPGYGIFFKSDLAGVESTLYSFGSSSIDGTNPAAGVVQGNDGNFYGTTMYGGSNVTPNLLAVPTISNLVGNPGNGTLFKISATGTETILYSFGANIPDIINPNLGLVFGSNGTLFGAGTFMNSPGSSCSANGCGPDYNGGIFKFGTI